MNEKERIINILNEHLKVMIFKPIYFMLEVL